MKQRGFSLTEVLIATAISSLLLISASRFLPGLQRAVLAQSGQRQLEEEVWHHLFALGKQLQRAGYCAGNCQGQALVTRGLEVASLCGGMPTVTAAGITAHQKMTAPVFVWSLARWKPSGGRRRVKEKDGKKLTDPDRLTIAHFVVRTVEHAGFAPEVKIELAAIRKGEQGEPLQALYTVTGYNL